MTQTAVAEWFSTRARMVCGRSAATLIERRFRVGSPHRIERFGTAYGGWYLCTDLLRPDDVALCVGAGEDVSFDVLLNARFATRVVCVDPTPRAIAHVEALIRNQAAGQAALIGNGPEEYALEGFRPERFHLIPCALWSSDTDLRLYAPRDARHVSHSAVNLQGTSGFITVPALRIATLLNHLRMSEVALLKLDVEGAEYEILRDLVASGVRPRQLLIEFEDANRPRSLHAFAELLRAVRALRAAGYELIHRSGSSFLFVGAGAR